MTEGHAALEWTTYAWRLGVTFFFVAINGFFVAAEFALVQAPKIWAINRARSASLQVVYPLRVFAVMFRPFIWLINEISNALLRLVGISPEELHETAAHSADELKGLLEASARSGHITARQLELTRNVLDVIGLEVRHIMVPRVDVEFVTLSTGTHEVPGAVALPEAADALGLAELTEIERLRFEPLPVAETPNPA